MKYLALLSLAIPVLADTIVMKNGDKLSGTIVTTGDKGIVFKSEFAGEVTIAWENVSEVSSANPVVITTKDGRKLTGALRTEGDAVIVGAERAERAAIAAVRPPDAQAKFELDESRKMKPQFLDLYSGFADFGLANANGNADTSTISTTANLARTTANDKFSLRFAQIYASNSTTGVSQNTAYAIRGGWAYQRNISKKWFLQGFNDYEFDKFQLLDLRVVVGGGLGYTAIKKERTLLTFGGGGAWNREQFGPNEVNPRLVAFTRNSGEIYFNQEFTHKLSSVLSVFERFALFPNLSNSGEFRLNFDAGIAATLYKSLALQAAFSDRYLSNPPVGRVKNDTLFTTGIRYTIPTRVK